jgi:hypothetical protein
MERMWDSANSTAVDKRRGVHEFYPGSRPLGGGSLHPASNLVYGIVVLQGAAVGGGLLSNLSQISLGAPLGGFIYAAS